MKQAVVVFSTLSTIILKNVIFMQSIFNTISLNKIQERNILVVRPLSNPPPPTHRTVWYALSDRTTKNPFFCYFPRTTTSMTNFLKIETFGCTITYIDTTFVIKSMQWGTFRNWSLGTVLDQRDYKQEMIQCVPRKGFGSAVCVQRDRQCIVSQSADPNLFGGTTSRIYILGRNSSNGAYIHT